MPRKPVRHPTSPTAAPAVQPYVTTSTQFKPGVYYEVRLSRPIMVAGNLVRPNATQILLEGDVANENRDAIVSAHEVPTPAAYT